MAFQLPKRAAESPVKPASGKAFRATKGPKYVLFLGDEGAILIYIKGNVVQNRQFVPDASQQNLREFRQTLHKDVAAPLILVVDNMDQSFMQQTLPPVSSLSVNRLIRRRLERDFGGNDIKGAILLGREKSGRKDWNFLMVALEKSPQLAVWLEFIQEAPNRFVGIHLASVESETLLKKLELAMGVAKEDDAEWKFFVSHNKVGGFRQVILKGGRIMFTRLAQPVGESNAEVIAGNIEQEMLSTIEYMKRLSFTAQSKLDIYIITSSAIKSVIDQGKFNARSFHILTPYEVAQYLGIEGAAQPTDQFGDVVTAAVIGCTRKHVLTMSTSQSKRVDQYYQFILFQRLATVLGVFAIISYAAYLGHGIYKLIEQTDGITQQKLAIEQGLETLRKNIKESNLDVEKASDLIDLYQQMIQEKLSPLPLLRKFEAFIQAPVWIKSFDWTISTEARSNKPRLEAGVMQMPDPSLRAGKTNVTVMVINLMLEFPQEASDPKIFLALSKKVLSDFQGHFKEYEVKYTSLPQEITDNDRLEIRSGQQVEIAPKSLDVQLSIKGDLSLLQALTQETSPLPVGNDAPAIPQPPVTPSTPTQ